MVDEAQDLNTCQTEIAIKLGKKGRILGVGDPKQSVYGFAGADCNSYENFRTRINAIELPLSIRYRCPWSHINSTCKKFGDLANGSSWKPDFLPLTVEFKDLKDS